MDKKKIEAMCSQIVHAANTIEVRGEHNMLNLLGIARNVRNVIIELSKSEMEDQDGR